jgi:hypothetical protein
MSNPSPTSVAKLRVDQVGSLLRPQKIKDVYARHGNGEAGDEEMRRIQDESIQGLIAHQETRQDFFASRRNDNCCRSSRFL